MEWTSFLNNLANHVSDINADIDIYIAIDDNSFTDQNIHEHVKTIQYANEQVVGQGYNNSCKVTIDNNCISWDKAIYHFCEKEQSHDFVWFIEDDVLIPTIESVVQMTQKYNSCDIVVPAIYKNTSGERHSWHWNSVTPQLPLPWYATMVCAVGMSKQLLQHIKSYVHDKRTIPFIEYIFLTLAMQHNMKVIVAPELEQIVYHPQLKPDDPTFIELVKKTYWIHPQKQMDVHTMVHDTSFKRWGNS